MMLSRIWSGQQFRRLSVILTCLALPVGQLAANGSDQKKPAAAAQSQPKTKTYHGDIHVEKSNSTDAFRPEPASASTAEGRKLYDKFNCAQCHQIEHTGGYAGPSLDGVGHYGRKYVVAHINTPQAEAVKKDKFFELVPTSMPSYAITPAQAEKIADYLMTLPANN